MTAAASKVLLGETVRKELFGVDSPVGQVIRINGQLFEVVGVLAPKGQNTDGRDQDDWILMPYTTAEKKIRGGGLTWLDDILCSAVSPDAVGPAIDHIVAVLRDRHHIRAGEEDDFNIRRPDEVLKAQLEAARALTLLLVSIASISLLVGGIGIMNVMLASVAQRTREIGVRLAIGARSRAIQLQFLGEAVMLSLGGGILGVALSVAGKFVFEGALGWPIEILDRRRAGGGGVVGGGGNVLRVLSGAESGGARSDRGATTRVSPRYSSICAPISTTRFGGSPKNAVAVRELRDRNANSVLRQRAMRPLPVTSSVSRPR